MSGSCDGASSLKFKHDIEDLDTGLDLITALRPVSYRMNHNDSLRFGFIAEEVEELDPRLVVHDEEGKPHALNHIDFIPVVVEAIQELATRLEALEAQLAAVGSAMSSSFSHVVDLVADTFTVGNEDAPTGITLFDEITGEPYCLSVRNGATITREGECEIQTVEEPPEGGGEEPPADEPPDDVPPPDESPIEEPPDEEEPPPEEPGAETPPEEETEEPEPEPEPEPSAEEPLTP